MAKREYIQANKDWLEAKAKEEGNRSRWDRYLGMTAATTQLPVPAIQRYLGIKIAIEGTDSRTQKCLLPLCARRMCSRRKYSQKVS